MQSETGLLTPGAQPLAKIKGSGDLLFSLDSPCCISLICGETTVEVLVCPTSNHRYLLMVAEERRWLGVVETKSAKASVLIYDANVCLGVGGFVFSMFPTNGEGSVEASVVAKPPIQPYQELEGIQCQGDVLCEVDVSQGGVFWIDGERSGFLMYKVLSSPDGDFLRWSSSSLDGLFLVYGLSKHTASSRLVLFNKHLCVETDSGLMIVYRDWVFDSVCQVDFEFVKSKTI